MGISNVEVIKVNNNINVNAGYEKILVEQHNFEDDQQHGFTCGGAPTSCGTLSKICGGYKRRGKNEFISKTFSVIPSSTYVIELDIIAVDSWDSNEYPYLELNGERVWIGSLHPNPAVTPGAALPRGNGNQCGISTQDRRWKYIAEKVFIPPGAATLNFLVGSTINEGSSNEALGIDNVKLFRIRPKRDDSLYARFETLEFSDPNGLYSTDRYVCSTNKKWPTGNTKHSARVTGPAFTATANGLTSESFYADAADAVPYEALVSACNENGCSLPAIVKTTKPQKPTMVTLIKEPTLFIANISLSNDGGMQISKIQ